MPDTGSTAAFERAFHGKHILVTGHTGFTGTWAVHWLRALGAEVSGLSLPPPTAPSLFEQTNAERSLANHVIGDIRNAGVVEGAVREIGPDAILHLAAQPLVRRSYAEPLATFDANVMGTANVLEAARRCAVAGILCITTDKVYANREWVWGYREQDRLGGADPYSASKAAAELVIDSYRASMTSWGGDMLIATARGGNIIGGGDWAEDRLIPDFIRSAAASKPIVLRNPGARRPWQHVLCLIHGYLALLARMLDGDATVAEAWNLGPREPRGLTVMEVVERLKRRWPDLQVEVEAATLHETSQLALDSTKAQRLLGWLPGWTTEACIDRTADWYAAQLSDPQSATAVTLDQIRDYRAAIAAH